jgi:hypothetical protein
LKTTECNPLLLLLDKHLGYAHNSFENPGNLTTNRKKRESNSKVNSACIPCLQKSFANSKAFGVKQLRIYKIQNNNKHKI